MPRYDAKPLEAKWQAYWDQQQTFKTGASEPAKSKLYVLDMFPYPSGAGLHVGHPEGYTATDIVCRYNRMKGRQVLHPMGWDAFGLPAEEYAIKTGTHPAITTAKNIETFKRQLKMLGFSYDWTRELATTDPDYFRWTQWIFLQLFDTWYDPDFAWTGPDGKKRIGRGRPISELPIPPDVAAQGEVAVRRYQDKQRLAYQHDAPVNWCPALGTVLANEEVIDGKSEVGGHPVERLPLRQWMLRITAYADRLATELDNLNWPESIKLLQRNWIGRSEGAEVDFWIGMSGSPLPPGEGLGVRDTIAKDRSSATTLTRAPASLTPALSQGEREFDAWKSSRAQTGFPHEPGDDVLRIYTTRPDTLFGATYMVLAPEHPAVDRLTTPEQRAAVDEYRKQAATKSDLDRTDLAKTKSGVFTGGYAINPVNREKIPVWIADYVLISYGTGAIMAVPAHDERDFMFAKQFGLPIRAVVQPPDKWIQWVAMSYAISLVERQENESAADLGYSASQIEQIHRGYVQLGGLPGKDVYPDSIEPAREDYLKRCGNWPVVFTELGAAVNSGPYTGIPTDEFKSKITVDLVAKGLGRKAVNYRLRDWLFSRQRYWGEPFPIWHELDANGQPTGLLRVDADSDLPITLPEMADFKPTGTPEPMLSKAPGSWLFKTAPDGKKLKRETNTMPQWAGSCWYYLRFVDNKNSQRFIDPELEKQWLPIDLYVGGAEHAVLHLLYSRFWHKVLFDRGYVHTAEPFQRLVNQGMILGEVEYTGFKLDEVQDGKTDDLAKLNAQVEELGLDVTKLENRLATLQADPVANPHEVTALQAQIAADKAKIAATLANEDTLRWVSAKQVNEAIDDEGQTIRIDLKTGQPVKPVKLSVDQIEKKGDGFLLKANPDIAVESRAYKMSKSRGNVINPDIVVDDYGADSLRLYEMFMGPLEAVKPWSMQGVEGVFRFLSRVWRTVTDEKAADVRLNSAVQDIEPTTEQRRLLHKTIRAVTNDLESLGFNTAISRMMEFINEVSGWDVRPVSIMKPFVLLLSPFAPHIAEELWSALGGTKTLAFEPWPTFDPQLVEDAEIEVPVQINGKLRGKVKVAAQADQSAVETAAKSDTLVAGQLAGKTIVKVVYVPGRMVNFVVK